MKNRFDKYLMAFLIGGLLGLVIRAFKQRRQCVQQTHRPPVIRHTPVMKRHTNQFPPHIWN